MINEYGALGATGMDGGGGAEVKGKNLSEFNFFHHKSHMTLHVIEPWPPRQETSEITARPSSIPPKRLLTFPWTTRRYIPQDGTLHCHRMLLNLLLISS
jgi:hypothetical protein